MSTYALSESHKALMEQPLTELDPEIATIMRAEIQRQRESILLIASENVTSRAVFDALGSPMSNKYSEGYPGARYYGGNQHIDAIERTCQNRALQTFGLDPKEWGVNVQTLSGSPANLQVYQAIMRPHDRLMGLDLPHGGHLSHGYQTPTKKISAVSTYFETMPYRVNLETGIIDYDALEATALVYRPKVLVAGTSAYCRTIDYARMRAIADKVGAYLLVDMAHISGLIAARVNDSPFPHADIVTTTTHKSLRGPRGAMIFFRRGVRRAADPRKPNSKPEMYDLENPINFSVFPGHQGGPHNHTITALAVALKQAQTPEFREYQAQVIANAKAMAKEFQALGYTLVTGGTDNHMILLDLKATGKTSYANGTNGTNGTDDIAPPVEKAAGAGLDGARAETILEVVNIACNKNTTPRDTSALSPGGLRLGAPAMTSRGMGEADFTRVAQLIDRALAIAKDIQASLPAEANKLKDFKAALATATGEKVEAAGPAAAKIAELKREISKWAGSFPLPVGGVEL